MSSIRILLLCLFGAFLLSSCKKEEDNTSAPKTETGTEEAQDVPSSPYTWDMSGVPVEGVIFSVAPNPIDFCESKTSTVEVHWDDTGAKVTALQIWLESKGTQPKLWVAPSAHAGSKMTGKWIQEGSKLIAVDARTNRALNVIPITAVPCN